MNQLNIPDKLHVGYQNRSDTYTGKLAYVIYTDEKGKKRKETSWNSWRNSKIEPTNLTNEPTSGFVLNKGVGGQRESYGWNARNEYIRVYDPRNFEFEISVANLLFILQECSSIKGKGLEGEFVYAWEGAELVLLPVDCPEYRASKEFTSLKSMKVTKKDMKEGYTYLHKNQNELIYLGRHLCKPQDEGIWGYKPITEELTEKWHVFYNLTEKGFIFEKGFTKLAKIVTQDYHPEYANKYSEFLKSEHVVKLKQVVLVPIAKNNILKCTHNSFFIKLKDDTYQETSFNRHCSLSRDAEGTIIITDNVQVPLSKVHTGYYREAKIITLEQLNQYSNGKLFTIEYELESGKRLGVYRYAQRQKN